MTDVVLYRLPSSDVRYLIFPVFKSEDDSDDFEEDFTERWIPELEVEDPADLRTIGILGIGNFGAVSLIQDPDTEKTYACNTERQPFQNLYMTSYQFPNSILQ